METSTLLVAILTFGFGFVNCFFGYRIFKTLLLLWGFVLGALIGAALVSQSQPVVILVVSVIAGVIGALIMRVLYLVGVFVMGASFGVAIGGVLMGILGLRDAGGVGLLVLLVAAIVGGILALAVQKLMLIIVTSFTGASGMVLGVMLLIPGAVVLNNVSGAGGSSVSIVVNPGFEFIVLVATLIVGAIGVMVQYRASRQA